MYKKYEKCSNLISLQESPALKLLFVGPLCCTKRSNSSCSDSGGLFFAELQQEGRQLNFVRIQDNHQYDRFHYLTADSLVKFKA